MGRGRINFFQDGAPIEFPEFVMVVVIAEHHAMIGQVGCRFFESGDECVHAVGIAKIHCARMRKGRVAAAQLLQAFDDGLGVVQDFIPWLMRGTADEALAVEDAEEFVLSNGTHSAHLNGLIAHGTNAAQGGGDFRWGLEDVAAGVKLGGELGDFHFFDWVGDFFKRASNLAKRGAERGSSTLRSSRLERRMALASSTE